MSRKKHILFLCSRLDLPGGIERAIVNTANLLQQNGHPVNILVLDSSDKSFYPVNCPVIIHQQPLSFGITKDGNIITRKIKMLSDVLKLRRLLKQINADVIIATEYPFAAAAVLTGAKKHSKLFAWEHHHYHELKRNMFWNRVYSFTYPRLDQIICLNADEKKIYDQINTAVAVIPNFIEAPGTVSGLANKTILTIARLTRVKGMDRLAEIAKIVFNKHPDWNWKIVGSGELEKLVEAKAREANVTANLEMRHPKDHRVMQAYVEASIYVMLSRHECFPMTLLEAQSAGLPAIAFDCESGPRHIIKHEVNGLLIEPGNINEMSDAICSLIEQEETRKKLGAQAAVDVQRFSPGKIYKLWETLINQD